MTFEAAFFKGKKVQLDKLLPFGFTLEQSVYRYKEKLVDGMLEAQVEIDQSGKVGGRLLDVDLQDEYIAFRLPRATGNFIGRVREEYGGLLKRMANSCFAEMPFFFDQTNRLAQHLSQEYGDAYDHPFPRHPQHVAFRHPANQKWYGLLVQVQRGRLDVKEEDWDEEALAEVVEVLNIKVAPERKASLLELPSVYPAYHMGKKAWISILLDGGLADELLFDLVKDSRDMVAPRTHRSSSGPDYWVIPANPKHYDIDTVLAKEGKIDWHQKGQIRKGDFVFIYITAPVQSLRYACRVIEASSDRMLLQQLAQFSDEEFSLDKMKTLGVTSVRGARRLTKELIAELQSRLSSE